MIIYGSDKKDSVLKVGRQTCPCCGQDGEYKLKRTDFVFTLFFVPCFPLGTFDTFAECCSCRAVYRPEKLSTLNVFAGYVDGSDDIPYTVASIAKRGFAFILDVFLLVIFNMGLATFLSQNPQLKEWLPRNFIFTFLIFWFIYFFLCELFAKGYTVGKRLLSVRTSVSYEFKPLNLLNNIIRALVKTLSCILPVAFIFAFWSRGNRAIHDWAGGSIVVSKLKTKQK